MGQKSEVYSVDVISDGSSRLIKNGLQFVSIVPGSTYIIKLGNMTSSRCDVNISIGGFDASTWRLEPREVLLIEEYPSTGAKFRIFQGGDLLRATFKAEKGNRKKDDEGSKDSVLKISNGELRYVPALDRTNIDWNCVTEVTIKLLLG